jgi:hypothetical protein
MHYQACAEQKGGRTTLWHLALCRLAVALLSILLILRMYFTAQCRPDRLHMQTGTSPVGPAAAGRPSRRPTSLPGSVRCVSWLRTGITDSIGGHAAGVAPRRGVGNADEGARVARRTQLRHEPAAEVHVLSLVYMMAAFGFSQLAGTAPASAGWLPGYRTCSAPCFATARPKRYQSRPSNHQRCRPTRSRELGRYHFTSWNADPDHHGRGGAVRARPHQGAPA